ncbi:MAG: M23 family metallopeptidase [Bacteroidaceae bacterium]|jgi:murein DD-endopeptidase MepM/ murein hydrolase activator NlpD
MDWKRNIVKTVGLFVCGLFLISADEAEGTREFTQMERSHVRVKTPGLFANGNSFFLNFDALPDEEWCFPLPGAKVISPYACKKRSSHTGTDLKTCPNDTIRAAFRGVVRMAKAYGAYGNVVVVRHDNGLETVYSHNSRNLVRVGQAVEAGMPIALTGRTGRATTEHLHFEVRVNGEHFNPALIFDMNKRTLRPRRLKCTRKGGYVAVRPVEAAR